MVNLEQKIALLVESAVENHTWRQRGSIPLIPSEQTPSPLVSLLTVLDPSGRYAEHRTIKGQEVYYYQGVDFIREVEHGVIDEFRHFLDCALVEPRAVSGTMANTVVFQAMVAGLGRRMTSVMNNDLIAGGHLSAQPTGALFNCVDADPDTKREKVVNFPVRSDNPYMTDVALLGDLIERHRPEMVVFGKSMFLFREPVAEVRAMVEGMKQRPVLMYDMAHTLGLYGAFQAPLAEGADILTGSTHKTFFGPQRGVIASNMPLNSELYQKLWVKIKGRAFPGSTSNHHLGTLLGLLGALYEMNEFGQAYQRQVISNAQAFAKALDDEGIQVEGKDFGFTETHQVIINVRQHGSGIEVAEKLEKNGIITNYQGLPHDKSFNDPSGIRMGVQEMTRFGMREQDFQTLAQLVSAVVRQDKAVRIEAALLRSNFVDMQYCLESSKTTPLALAMVNVILPGSVTV